MWSVEQAEKDAERERNKKYRAKRARRIIDRQLIAWVGARAAIRAITTPRSICRTVATHSDMPRA